MGTTRDLVSAAVVVDGWNFELVDSAGLRETNDAIEQAGAKLATESAKRADVALLTYDPQRGYAEQREVFRRFVGNDEFDLEKKSVAVLNKIDLPISDWNDEWKSSSYNTIGVSAKTGAGLDELFNAIVEKTIGKELDLFNRPVVWTREQEDALRQILLTCNSGKRK